MEKKKKKLDWKYITLKVWQAFLFDKNFSLVTIS